MLGARSRGVCFLCRRPAEAFTAASRRGSPARTCAGTRDSRRRLFPKGRHLPRDDIELEVSGPSCQSTGKAPLSSREVAMPLVQYAPFCSVIYDSTLLDALGFIREDSTNISVLFISCFFGCHCRVYERLGWEVIAVCRGGLARGSLCLGLHHHHVR